MIRLQRTLIYILLSSLLVLLFLPQTVLGTTEIPNMADESENEGTELPPPTTPVEEPPKPEEPIKEEPQPEPTKPPDNPGTGGTPGQTEQPKPQEPTQPKPDPKPNQEDTVKPAPSKPASSSGDVKPTAPSTNTQGNPVNHKTSSPTTSGSNNSPSDTSNAETNPDETATDEETDSENVEDTEEVKVEDETEDEELLEKEEEEKVEKPTKTEIASVSDQNKTSTSFVVGMIIFSLFVLVVIGGAGYWWFVGRKRR